ncbi:MAG: xylose isomerase, partial [Bacillota bacterium]
MKVGAAPISWGVSEFPEWGRQLPYQRVFDEMAQAGYEGTELGPPGYLPLDPALLKDELARRGLAMIAAFVPVNMRSRAAAPQGLAGLRRPPLVLAGLAG